MLVDRSEVAANVDSVVTVRRSTHLSHILNEHGISQSGITAIFHGTNKKRRANEIASTCFSGGSTWQIPLLCVVPFHGPCLLQNHSLCRNSNWWQSLRFFFSTMVHVVLLRLQFFSPLFDSTHLCSDHVCSCTCVPMCARR